MKVPCWPRFWSVINIFDTRFGSNLENCDLEDQISASHKWDGGHERVFFPPGFVTVQKEHENEDWSEVLLKQDIYL